MTPEAKEIYADIIGLEWEPKKNHPRMSLHDRAAQFAPFAALVGYDEMVDEEARVTDRQVEPSEEDLNRLNRQLARLSSLLAEGQRPRVSILLFIPDSKKAGGRYETVTGKARKLEPENQRLIILREDPPAEEAVIGLDRILDLSGEDLGGPE